MVKKFFIFIISVSIFLINETHAESNIKQKQEDKKTNQQNYELEIKELVIDEEKLPLKLHNLIDLALERNLFTKQSYLNVKISEYNLKSQKSVYLPSLSIYADYSERDGELYNNRQQNFSNGASINYTLFAFGKNRAGIKATEHYLNMVKYQENETIQKIIYDVVVSYYSILSYQAKKETATEMENLSLEIYKSATLKHKLGLVPLADKLDSKSSYSRTKLEKMKIDNEIKKQKAELNNLLNLEPEYILYIEKPEIKIKKNKNNFEYFVREAKNYRNDIKILYENRLKLKQELKEVELERYPEINLNGNFSNDKDVSTANTEAYYSTSFAISAKMPLFNGFKITNTIKQKEKEIEKINFEIKELEKNIEKEVWNVFHDLDTAQSSYNLAKDVLESSSENAKVVLGMYKNGKTSMIQVLDAQAKLKDAKVDFINTKYDWLIYRVKLLKIIGKMNLDNIINIERF